MSSMQNMYTPSQLYLALITSTKLGCGLPFFSGIIDLIRGIAIRGREKSQVIISKTAGKQKRSLVTKNRRPLALEYLSCLIYNLHHISNHYLTKLIPTQVNAYFISHASPPITAHKPQPLRYQNLLTSPKHNNSGCCDEAGKKKGHSKPSSSA